MSDSSKSPRFNALPMIRARSPKLPQFRVLPLAQRSIASLTAQVAFALEPVAEYCSMAGKGL